MLAHYKIQKQKNSEGKIVEYLQIREGSVKGQGKFLGSLGHADKALKVLVSAKKLSALTKKYPDLLTKLLEELGDGFD